MSLRKQVLTGATVLGSTQAIGQILAFARNIIIARLLTPADFGIAATFSITMLFIDMMSNLAADKLIVQARNGDDASLQRVAHLIGMLRGILSGLVIVAVAAPIAHLFNTPEAIWAFRVLGLVPAIRGFRHLDVQRVQREMRFAPSAAVDVIGQVVALSLAWPLASWLGNYSAVLWLLLAQSLAQVIVSHVLAERPFAMGWSREHARQVVKFGWPLLINGVLMYGIFQGDQLIVGANYSMAELGVYAVAFTLTITPTMLIGRLGSSLFLPVLSSVQDNPRELTRRASMCFVAMVTIASLSAVLFIVAGGSIVTTLYGEKYAAAGAFIGWLGAMQAVRIVRVAPALTAMATGDTSNMMYANLTRVLSLSAALVAASMHANLSVIAMASFFGELVALSISIGLLRYRQGLAMGAWARSILTGAGLVVLAWAVSSSIGDGENLILTGALASALIFMVFAGMYLLLPDLRKLLHDLTSPLWDHLRRPSVAERTAR